MDYFLYNPFNKTDYLINNPSENDYLSYNPSTEMDYLYIILIPNWII